jgi:hypothetical protein
MDSRRFLYEPRLKLRRFSLSITGRYFMDEFYALVHRDMKVVIGLGFPVGKLVSSLDRPLSAKTSR